MCHLSQKRLGVCLHFLCPPGDRAQLQLFLLVASQELVNPQQQLLRLWRLFPWQPNQPQGLFSYGQGEFPAVEGDGHQEKEEVVPVSFEGGEQQPTEPVACR